LGRATTEVARARTTAENFILNVCLAFNESGKLRKLKIVVWKRRLSLGDLRSEG
jgi:hypothetical protein